MKHFGVGKDASFWSICALRRSTGVDSIVSLVCPFDLSSMPVLSILPFFLSSCFGPLSFTVREGRGRGRLSPQFCRPCLPRMRSAALALPPVQAPPSAALAAALATALAPALATGRHPLAPHHSDSPYRGSPTERHASGLPAAPSPPTALRRTWKGGGSKVLHNKQQNLHMSTK